MSNSNHAEGIARLKALPSADLYLKVDPTNRAAIVGWGTTFNVLQFVDAIARLHEAGCCYAAAPLRRSALEYMMWTVWLGDAGDGAVDAMNRSHQYLQGKIVSRLDAAGESAKFLETALKTARDRQAVPLPNHPDETLASSVKNLLDAYEPEEPPPGWLPLRILYDVESMFAHASLGGSQVFFSVEPKVATRLTQTPQFEEAIPCLHYGLILLFTTMLSYNELLSGKPWTDPLQAIADDFGLSTNLPRRAKRPGEKAKAGD